MDVLQGYLTHVIAGASLLFSLVASAHAVMYKRESRAAAAWVALIWLSPFIGAGLYVLLGINRIHRKAMSRRKAFADTLRRGAHKISLSTGGTLERAIDQVAEGYRQDGHRVDVLENGDAAYPAMHAAIAQAKTSVRLCTYIFDRDRVGLEFRDVLRSSVARGVDVRVIIDDVGARYSFPSIVRALRKAGVRVARFGRSGWPWYVRYANLRNHRKILLVDGAVAFAGGMNIRDGNVLQRKSKHATRDLHFRFQGPVVGELDLVFCDDWKLATKEDLAPGQSETAVEGQVRARCLADGPDTSIDTIRWTMLSALACSTTRVRIVTPYFVPDARSISALCTAALRGVRVEIFLPEANNLRLVKWASQALLWQVLERGCHVFMSPAPFDHSKVMLVDDDWCLVGSANWDTRSLRLNFEVNLECQDTELCTALHAIVDRKLAAARAVTLQDIDNRSTPVRLRDGVARLFSPYL